MKAVLVVYDDEREIRNGIFNDVKEIESKKGLAVAIYSKRITSEPIIFSGSEILSYFSLTVKGKTYTERKTDLFNKALSWHYAGSVAPWSYGEIAEIQNFFEVNGRRYGLLKEFRENCIC